MQYNIGQVLATETNSYNATIHRWNSKIIPAIRSAAKEYEDLGIGDFDQAVLEEVINKQVNKIETRYAKTYEKEVTQGIKGKALAATLLSPVSIAAAFESFRIAAMTLINKFDDPGLSPYVQLQIHLDDCKIISGQPVLNEEQIKKRFDLVITNEDQAEFMELAEKLKTAHDTIMDFINAKLPARKFDFLVVGHYDQASRSVAMMGDNQYLDIDRYFIEEFKK